MEEMFQFSESKLENFIIKVIRILSKNKYLDG